VTSRPRGRTPRCGWWTLSAPADSAAASDPASGALTRVTPTRRLAHHLRARHDAACLERGLEIWDTPDIVTWDELVERMFALDRQAGRLEGRWLPASASQLIWARIVRDDPERSPLVSPAGVARAAWQSWRALHDYGIPVEALERGESPETEAFARWCGQYRELLAARGWVDGTQAQARVHALAAAPGVELVGFDRLTPLQAVLLERWRTAGLELRHAAAPTPAAGAPASVRRVTCLDEAAEIEAAARWAAARLDGRDDLRVAVVVPDLARRREAVRRGFERVLVPAAGLTGGPGPESRAFELAVARPLVEQPVVGAALDLLDALVRPPDLVSVSRLLRSGFLAGVDTEASSRARLDARIRRFEGPGLGGTGLERMAREHGCPVLADQLAAVLTMISRWPEKDFPSNWSKSVLNALSVAGWPGPGSDGAEYQAEQRWRALVSEFGACDEFTGRVSSTEAVGLLREMAGRVLFEPQELRAPLLVIDAETSAGMRFDALWVCGLDASNWPEPGAPDPFLPRHLQLRHGLPRASAALAAEESRRRFERLLASAPEVILSVPEVERDAPLLPSPLLAGIADLGHLARWSEPRVAVAAYTGRPPLEVVNDHRMPPVVGSAVERGGARLLELQAACPFRAQAELRLGARALDEPTVGVDASDRGNLVHAALAHLWRELGDQATLAGHDAAGRRAATQRAVAAALSKVRGSADELLEHLLDLEADWLEARVLDLIEVDLARAPFVVESIETARTARIGALTLELRPDRVDRLADGSLAVIDYKTGGDAEVTAWLDERPRLPQLPAYVQALGSAQVRAVAFARVRSGDTRYEGVARDGESFPGLKVPGGRGGPRGFDRWDTLIAEWQRRIEALANEYAAGDARLAPDPPRACEYCHLGALCRIAETRSGAVDEGGGDE
jgi:probable DNA repair protein